MKSHYRIRIHATLLVGGCGLSLLLAVISQVRAQAPPPGAAGGGGQGRGQSQSGRGAVLDAAAVASGREVFGVKCASCHGPDARGTDKGVDLIRSEFVRLDSDGQQLAQYLPTGKPGAGMPKFDLPAAQVASISVFLRSQIVIASAGRGGIVSNIIVGDAKAGEAYFNGAGKCNTCHSVTGDLKGIGSKYGEVYLQNRIVMPRGRGGAARIYGSPPDNNDRSVTVTDASGHAVTGALVDVSDFSVTLRDSSGQVRSFTRKDGIPKVEVKDALQGHIDNLKRMTTSQMHDLTAYLVNK
jgi:cytochrome c oxidase cbb3-type subunit 3